MSVNRNKKILRWKFLQFSNTKPAKHACKASYLTSPSSCLIEERWPSCRGKSLINFTLLSLSPVTFFSLWFPTMEHLNMFKTFPLKTRHASHDHYFLPSYHPISHRPFTARLKLSSLNVSISSVWNTPQ